MDKLLSKYEVGTREEGNLRFCGKRFICKDDAITIDVADNTRKVTKITKQAMHEISTLRSVIGSLSWIARQGRPDLSYRVSRLETMVKGAIIATLKEANKVVDLAIGGLDLCIRYPTGMCDFNDLGVLTVTDASFAGEPGMKSQQGRMHFYVLPRKSGIQSVSSSLFFPALLPPPPSSEFATLRSRQKRTPYSQELSPETVSEVYWENCTGT